MIALASAKHSPGVTTLIQAMAALCEPMDPIVFELDPAGGDLAAREGIRLSDGRGLASLLLEARHRPVSVDDVYDNAVALPSGGFVVLGTPTAHVLENIPSELLLRLAPVLAQLDGPVFVDCGRLVHLWQLELMARVDVAVIALRPSAADARQVRGWVSRFPENTNLQLVQVAPAGTSVWRSRKGYHPREVEDFIGVPVVGAIADDPAGADGVMLGRASDKRVRTSPFVRSAAALLENLMQAGARKDHSDAAAAS